MKLSYWIFTSGEKGVHGLDWGIKFASESFSDKYALDVEYRDVLKNFSLNPSLKRPNDLGFLVLPFRNAEYITGFIFPSIDHGGRRNTSAVIALIPSEIPKRMTVNELLGRIWCGNDIPDIARKNSEVRPDILILGENSTWKLSSLAENLKWPNRNEGYIFADGEFESLVRIDEAKNEYEKSTSHSRHGMGIIIAGVAIIAVIAGGVFMFMKSDTPPKIDTPLSNQATEPQTPVTSQNSQNLNTIAESEDSQMVEPRKSIMQGIVAVLESYEGTKDFMREKSLVSFDISASRRSLPEAFIDKDGITQALVNLFGNIKPTMTKEGFMLRPDRKKLPIEEWHTRKTEIFSVITAENLRPAKSLQHDRLLNSIKSSEAKEGWLTLYFRTQHENVNLVALVNISGSGNPLIRLEGKSDGLIPVSESAGLSAKSSERETPSGYRIIFIVPEKFRDGANDFSSWISVYIQQFSEEEY